VKDRAGTWRLVAAAVAVVAFVLVLLSTPAPRLRHTSALNALFDSRWLLAGARLVVAVAILYVLASIAVRVWHQQWVRSAGSIETDASAARVSDDREELKRQLDASKETIEELQARLQDSVAARAELLATLEPGARCTPPEQEEVDPRDA
jgi:hypothetical protein